MKKVYSLAIILLGFTFVVGNLHAQDLEVPYHDSSQTVIDHYGFTLLYNETHGQASWVAYELTADETDGPIDRTDDFRADPQITTGSASLSDYKYSGYDRGHLIPAGDAQWSESAMSATFVISNMSPQEPGFNRGEWRSLESNVRAWAKENGTLYVVTGPALKLGAKERIGDNRVSVPRYYYKVVLDYKKPERKGIGFIVPNRSLALPLTSYVVTVDSVESATGIDFYHKLPDNQERKIESEYSILDWDFDIESSNNSTNDSNESEAIRCKGITNDGTRCKRRTKNASGYCWQHN